MTEINGILVDHAPQALAVGGLLIGLAFGYLTQAANFCTMGSITSWITLGDTRGVRAWGLAVAIAIMAVAVLTHTGSLDLSRSMYTTPRLNWAGSILGGLMFGTGMVFAGGCASRNLVRAGAGDVRSALTLLVTSLFASMTMGGVLGPLRAGLDQWTALTLPMPSQRLTDVWAAIAGTGTIADLVLPAALAIGLAAVCLADKPFRTSRRHLSIGIGVGLLIAASWALTGLAFDEMADRVQRPVALSFVKPSADAIDWLQRTTALGLPGFGVASVFGTMAGGALSALVSGRFHVMAFANRADTWRHMAGAALMGTGGVLALGCSIGQGISGLSTLALGSALATAAIVAGAIFGLKLLQNQET